MFFRELKKEIKKTTSSTYLKLVIFAVMLVPLLYGAVYLKAFWDPYAKINQVPVAVVNLDKGYIDNGKAINIGNDLVTKLKSDHNLKWEFVDEATANKGLDQKKYYSSLTVPADFTATTYSVDGTKPTNAKLSYKSREATNYLATTITKQVTSRVTDSLSHEVTKKYLDNIFINLKSTADGLVTAKNASIKLADGLISANKGLDNLQIGLQTASSGSTQLVNGLDILNVNQNKFTNNISTALDGTNKLTAGAKDVSDGLTAVSSNLTIAQSIVSNYITNHPDSTSELGTAYGIIAGVNNNLTTKLEPGQLQIASGLNDLSYNLEIAKSSSIELTNGSSQLLSGAKTLNSGLLTATSGAGSLSTGLVQVENGTVQLRDSLTEGADKAVASTEDKKVAAETIVMAAPISMADNSYDIVPNYGSGFAPYFISLALWVGGILSFFAIDFDKKPKTKTAALVKYAVLAIIGVVQAIALDTVLKNVLGLSVVNPVQYYGFTILVSLTFMAFLQLLIQHMGNVGRYTAIVMLILQLTSAAGTFPKETLPLFFQIINPLLPMTYSVLGFRDILFTHELSNLYMPIIYFVSVFTTSLLLNLFLTKRQSIKSAHKAL